MKNLTTDDLLLLLYDVDKQIEENNTHSGTDNCDEYEQRYELNQQLQYERKCIIEEFVTNRGFNPDNLCTTVSK